VVDDESARISQIIVYINKDEDEPVAVNYFLAYTNNMSYADFMSIYYPLGNGCDETTFNGCGCSEAYVCPVDQHFRGWQVTWDISTGTETHCFGDCSTAITPAQTRTLTFTDEVMYFSMSVDANDVEGFAFKEYSQTLVAACNLKSYADQLLDPACYQPVYAGPANTL
jgi:hypothetical protein